MVGCIFKRILFCILLLTAINVKSSDPGNDINYDIVEQSLEDCIKLPQVPAKAKNAIVAYMRDVTLNLQNKKINVRLERNNEVVVIVIPTDYIFPPNSTELKPQATTRLQPLIPYLKSTDFKIVFSVNSDNTGSEEYTELLTEERGYAVYEWIEQQDIDVTDITFYPMGAFDPICPNNSMANRQKNRRIEIYLIPNESMINKAKSNKLK